jgi:hypothetical protein
MSAKGHVHTAKEISRKQPHSDLGQQKLAIIWEQTVTPVQPSFIAQTVANKHLPLSQYQLTVAQKVDCRLVCGSGYP